MVYIAVLAVLVATILGLGIAGAMWHRRHPGAAHLGMRDWWTGRGWTWSRHAYLTVHLAFSLLVTVVMLVVFARISALVTGHAAITQFDEQFDAHLHSIASPAGLRVATFLSLIGGPPAMAVLGLTGAVLLFFRRHDRELLVGWLMAIGGGGVLDWVLKSAFRRPRPLFADPFAHGYGFSFPSGHSMGSVIGFGMLAYVLVQVVHRESARIAIVVVAGLLCLGIGISRLYLGVHFPSDVLAGFAAGLMWLAACIAGLEIARERHPLSAGLRLT